MDTRLRSYQPKHFATVELVSRKTYAARGEKALQLLDPRILISGDTLREELTALNPDKTEMGALTCNDWYFGGKNQYRGYRAGGEPYYGSYSAHAGRALDLVSKYHTAEFLREFIIKNREKFPYVTRLEGDVNWLHMDCNNLPSNAPRPDSIMIVYPDGSFKYV
ncbi:hypothetical protein HW45_03685 [Vibrio sp. ER1A]|nr:hypothetical protein HW45_03685 [Vibrio sp. ER1A]